MQSSASEFGFTPPCLDHPPKPVSSGAHNSPRVDTVKIVVGGFGKQLPAVNPEMKERCGRSLDDQFLETAASQPVRGLRRVSDPPECG